MRPLIGLTFDFRPPEWEHGTPFYRINQPYITSVAQSGGVPIVIPYAWEVMDTYLDTLHGLILTGGPCDVHPRHYGQEIRHPSVAPLEARTDFEMALLQKALTRRIPVLGICGGVQVLNVFFGGTLIQHIPETHLSSIDHTQSHSRFEGGHDVEISPGTQLARIVDTPRFAVNTAHHQAIDCPAADLIVNARAPDGIIEGIEHPDYDFCIGVQWHPEYRVSSNDASILQALIAAARERGLTSWKRKNV